MSEKKKITAKELEKVSGGWSHTTAYGDIFWKYDIGNHVEIKTIKFFHQFTDGGTIRKLGVGADNNIYAGNPYFPAYYVDGDSAAWYKEDLFDNDHRYSDADIVCVFAE